MASAPILPPALALLLDLRPSLDPASFKAQLRQILIDNPTLQLSQVATAFGVSKQRIHSIVGPLGRPTCAHTGPRPAPRTVQAHHHIPELTRLVQSGFTAEQAADQLGISVSMARVAGFAVRRFRPRHGSLKRAKTCQPPCWRCRRALGVKLPRGPKSAPVKQAHILDWLAFTDPDTHEPLKQSQIAKLAGVQQPTVSRLIRSLENS